MSIIGWDAGNLRLTHLVAHSTVNGEGAAAIPLPLQRDTLQKQPPHQEEATVQRGILGTSSVMDRDALEKMGP